MKNTMSERQKEVVNLIDDTAPERKWRDWRWQLRSSAKTAEDLEHLLDHPLSAKIKTQIYETTGKFPMSITPYYLSLINTDDIENCPIFLQSVPRIAELDVMEMDMEDPLHEEMDSPVDCITHRYPDRVLFLISNVCSMYCRFCTRKRKVGDSDFIPNREVIQEGIDYIKKTPVIRDVLLSGGDPFLLNTDYLEWILYELRKIDHVEVIRIGTRTPVVLPMRITPNLVEMLKQYHPVWVNTHFNHPREITQSARNALAMLADAGIPLGNQSVLLAGVNDCPRIMKSLMHELVKNRVRPYYMYQCDMSEGLSHFRTPIAKGMEIMESLIGHTSGFARPTYVVDAPGGGGKIPINPSYLISWSTNKAILRNYEGVISSYREPDNYDQHFCDRQCRTCEMHLDLSGADEYKATGIEKLLSSHEQVSLIPTDNERVDRFEDEKQSDET